VDTLKEIVWLWRLENDRQNLKEKSEKLMFQFIERRRAALERFMNRTAAHPSLRADPDFREFLELVSILSNIFLLLH
jgi:PX domain